MGAFADKVRGAIDDYWANAALVVIGTIEEASRRLIIRSPIGMPSAWKRKPPPGYVPGKFVSNWNLGIGSADRTVSEATNLREVNGLSRIPADPFGKRYVISNSSPQAMRLEVDGWSKQAPNGMVRLTGLEFDDIVKDASTGLKRSGGRR